MTFIFAGNLVEIAFYYNFCEMITAKVAISQKANRYMDIK